MTSPKNLGQISSIVDCYPIHLQAGLNQPVVSSYYQMDVRLVLEKTNLWLRGKLTCFEHHASSHLKDHGGVSWIGATRSNCRVDVGGAHFAVDSICLVNMAKDV